MTKADLVKKITDLHGREVPAYVNRMSAEELKQLLSDLQRGAR